MIEKFVVDPQKDQDQTILELAQRLNEMVDVVNSPALRAGRPVLPTPGPAQHIAFIEMTTQRLLTGPYKLLDETEPNDLTKTIGEALTTLQGAVKAYKESLVGETKATLEV